MEQLISKVERGVLVTHFWYIRFVNQQTLQHTGLTRDGLFLIENGKVTTPITNFRFLESPVHLLKNTIALGKAQRVRGTGRRHDDCAGDSGEGLPAHFRFRRDLREARCAERRSSVRQ